MPAQNFVFKPESDNTGNLVVLTPSSFNNRISEIQLVDAQGNVIETGSFRTIANENRSHFDFSRPGTAFGDDVRTLINFNDGTAPLLLGVGGGSRVDRPFSDGLPSNAQQQENPFGEGFFFDIRGKGGGAGGSNIGQSPGGTSFVDPSFVDFSQLEAPFVDFPQQLEFAQGVGQESKDIFFQNIEDSREAALGLTLTDIAGTTLGLNAFIPRARAEGRQDLQENIRRAAEIDAFNFSRLGRFNEFNIEQQQAAVAGAGLDFRGRITTLLDNLEARAAGEIPAGLGEALDTALRNQGSDLLRSTGIGATSGAGIRAIDRLQVQERLNLALGAEAQIPGVLAQGQQTLQAPTAFAQPQQVPLIPSDIASRIPITPNISAGAVQQQLATTATQLQAIPATTALTTGLQTAQFNEQGAFNRDKFVLQAEQAQLSAADNALQGAINQDTAADIRAEQQEFFLQGQQQAQAAVPKQQSVGLGVLAGLGGLGAIIGAGGGAGGVNPIAAAITGGGELLGAIGQGIAGVLDQGISGLGSVFGDEQGNLNIGDTTIPTDLFTGLFNDAKGVFTGINPDTGGPFQVNGQDVLATSTNEATQQDEYLLADQTTVQEADVTSSSGGLVGEFRRLAQPFADAGIDAQVLQQTGTAILNWDQLSGSQQIQATGNVGVSVAENKGIVTPEQANDLRTGVNALSVVTNPNASAGQKATAISSALASTATTSFTGSSQNPTSIGGVRVLGGESLPDGTSVWNLADGTQVPAGQLLNTVNVAAGLGALSVLSSGASTENKLAALTAMGIPTAAANNIITQVQAGNALAGLSIFNTARNWDKMNPFQQAVAVTQAAYATTSAATSAAAQAGASGTGAGLLSFFTGSSAVTASQQAGATAATTAVGEAAGQQAGFTATGILGGAAAVAGVALGIKVGADTIDAANDMSQSKAVGTATTGLTAAGASIGAGIGSVIPGVGTAIGAGVGAAVGALAGVVVGSTGTGKNSGQQLRDSWRDGLEAAGFAAKNEQGSHEVTLADGTKYDIGKDGGHKLENVGTNIDGKDDRFTFDVDWSNPTAVESIPDAHIFALASGLDPTSNDDFGLFHRAVGQSLNAATSNASTKEAVQENFKAMLKDTDPREVAMRVETLRVTNKISEEEYGVYLNSINEMFGSQIQVTDRQKAVNSLVQQLSAVPASELGSGGRDLLETLTNENKLAEAQKRLDERLAKELADIEQNDTRRPKKKTADFQGGLFSPDEFPGASV